MTYIKASTRLFLYDPFDLLYHYMVFVLQAYCTANIYEILKTLSLNNFKR